MGSILVLLAACSRQGGVPGSNVPGGNNNPPGQSGGGITVQQPPPPTAEPLPGVQLATGISALEAYDAVLPHLQDEVAGLPWTSLSGNEVFGWAVAFYDEPNAVVLTFNVAPDGTVTRSPELPAQLVDSASLMPMDRATITVDSPEVEQRAADAGLNVTEPPLMYLNQTPEGTPEWLVTSTIDGQSITFSAIGGQ